MYCSHTTTSGGIYQSKFGIFEEHISCYLDMLNIYDCSLFGPHNFHTHFSICHIGADSLAGTFCGIICEVYTQERQRENYDHFCTLP